MLMRKVWTIRFFVCQFLTPDWNYIESLSGIPPHLLKEIELFPSIYKEVEAERPT